jgi:phosphate transport system substrate-binding protein
LHRKRLVGFVVAAVVASMSVATGVALAAGSLTGAGSTLVQPLMAQWQAHSGINITYGAVGSGDGIADITARSVDFGASDAPLTASQAAACHGCTQIPWALTATGITFNVPGVHSLRLTGPIISQIYLGQITNWDANAIKKINKHTHLPNLKITPVFRSDGSGDTYAFTNFLSKESSTWAHRIGFATSVSFPTGIGAAHNSGMVSAVQSTNGSIGYIAAAFLIQAHLPAAALENAAGKFEYPNLKNISNAASQVKKLPRGNALHIVDPSKKYKTAYPLSTFTYGIFPDSSSDSSTLKALVRYAVGTGQKYGPALDFQPLPKFIRNADNKAAKALH